MSEIEYIRLRYSGQKVPHISRGNEEFEVITGLGGREESSIYDDFRSIIRRQ